MLCQVTIGGEVWQVRDTGLAERVRPGDLHESDPAHERPGHAIRRVTWDVGRGPWAVGRNTCDLGHKVKYVRAVVSKQTFDEKSLVNGSNGGSWLAACPEGRPLPVLKSGRRYRPDGWAGSSVTSRVPVRVGERPADRRTNRVDHGRHMPQPRHDEGGTDE